MKKVILALVITLCSLAFVVILAAVLVSPLSKRYIVTHSKELTADR